ncbi:MAG: hypothetical protein CVU39_16140 [Chloroflexi bacterium HGW-Chloroflexi-10]|nr:MAG: hypothetical protein CVU39_16140 [Chloroflexi bacterium HGW-Chloroflexi-10]
MMRRVLSKSLGLALILLLGVINSVVLALPGDYLYDQPGDKNYVNNTNVLERYSTNNQSVKITAPRAQANATFTSESIVVDGVRDAAWDAATPYPITNTFNTAMTAAIPDGAQGSMRLLWDGPVLYILVEVTGDSTQSDTGTPAWSSASYTPTTDGLFVNMDVFNDQWGLETDTQGVFFLPANPTAPATSFNNSGIPSLGSFFNASNQDYSPRLNASRSSGYSAGEGVNYTYEIALQTEGWGDAWERELNNGTKIGLELGIFDQGSSFTYWSKTQFDAGNEGGSNLPNSERVRNRDWGEVTLSGWDEVTPFAYSGWRADENIRFWDSKSNPGGTGVSDSGDASLVWTDASKARMIAAKDAYKLIKDSPTATREEKDAAVLEVCEAFAGLRWADTTYPDPHDLPVLNTLPSVWEFFDTTKGTDGKVTNLAEWNQRKQEILDLAQFYEYGYKPKLGVDYTINLTSNAYDGTGKPSVTARVTPTNVNFTGGVYQDVTISVTLPTAGVPEGMRAPVAFSGGFTANGIADITFPNWAGDSRTDTGAWGNPNRSGTFYTLFPYSRNSTSADVSIEMANATAVSVYLDILQMAVAENAKLDARIDPTQAVTKGFSINGKIAFVAAVFDERVKAVVTGGAGATGPANWRYNVQGQEYNFTDTIFYNAGAENIVAHGTEGPGNSYRHNRVRETELFRHFLPYGHEYVHEDGSYGYGDFSRLPFDQTSLVATLAPDRAIIIDTNMNDYNDGAVTDNMSLQIAKSVYNTLGANADNYVKFNSGNYVSSGDPHGAASATPEGHYLSDLFYGTTTLTIDEASRLNTDPYNLNVSNEQTQTPYDYYWGGFNTITGGTGGVSGVDGWYYYAMTVLPEIVINVQPAANMELLLGYATGHSLFVGAETRGDAGTLSYQWYSNTTNSNTGGTLVDGATSASFEIPTGLEVGTYYYYVVVSSDGVGVEARTSNVAPVTVRIPSHDASLQRVAINITSGPWYAQVTTTYVGTPHSNNPLAYDIVLPYATDLDALAATAFEVIANNPGASVGSALKFDSGARWTITITAEDGTTAATYTIYLTTPFIAVDAISGVPSTLALGEDLILSESYVWGTAISSLGSVAPANATNKTIVWSLSDTTHASIVTTTSGWVSTKALHLASTAAPGTEIVLTATITNGSAPDSNYVQNFTITVPFIAVDAISDVPSEIARDEDLRLSESLDGSITYSLGTVEPADASYKTITWSLSDTTNASIVTSGGGESPEVTVLHIASTAAEGTQVVLTATITNGTAPDSNYVQNFTITVTVNDAPVALADSYDVDETRQLSIDAANGVLANDTDVDSPAITAVLVSTTANGTLTLNADGSFTYTPNVDFGGVDTFTYKATDGKADSNVVTVTINVPSIPVTSGTTIFLPLVQR